MSAPSFLSMYYEVGASGSVAPTATHDQAGVPHGATNADRPVLREQCIGIIKAF